MTISNFDMLFYTLAFIVPGFIMSAVIAMFLPQKQEQFQTLFLRFLTFSCLNYAVWSWLFYILQRTGFPKDHPYKTAAIWGGIILVSPIVIGVIVGFASKKQWLRGLLQKLGFNPVHIIPTWDFKFYNTPTPQWVIITLKDGSIVAGYYGGKSFASSEGPERDIFIEKVYKIPDDNTQQWEEVEGSQGILIKSDIIKHIEFLL